MTPLIPKLPVLLGFIFVLLFTTSTKDDFIGHTAKAEVNSTKISMNNLDPSGSNTSQINMTTPLNNSIKHVIIIVMENKGYTEVIGSDSAPYQNQYSFGKAINNGTLNGKILNLYDEGKSCLYHAHLPNGITDIDHTSNRTLDFDTGGYSVTVSIHGTPTSCG